MNREQLAHVLRAACRIVQEGEVVVIGSQAILGSFPEARLPEEATRSIEADIAFEHDPDQQSADLVDSAIGELSQFHQTFAYYGQGVSVETAILPTGWRDRVVPFVHRDLADRRVVCLEPHDLVISKLYADRPKDRDFATALIHERLIDPSVLHERADLLPFPDAVRRRVRESIRRRVREANLG